MKKTTLKQVTLEKKKTATYNEIAIDELKQEINVLEELSFIAINKASKWLEKTTGITI